MSSSEPRDPELVTPSPEETTPASSGDGTASGRQDAVVDETGMTSATAPTPSARSAADPTVTGAVAHDATTGDAVPSPEPHATPHRTPGALPEEPAEDAIPARDLRPQDGAETDRTTPPVATPGMETPVPEASAPVAEPSRPIAETPGPAAEPSAPVAEPSAPVSVTGAFEPYTIGNPGRAFSHAISLTETKHRDAHDIVIDAATVPDPEGTHRLVLRAASSRGLSHQQYGDPRQDDHCTVLSRDGEWLICLVADGVSSGEWSHLAAKMATEEGATEILRLLETHEPADIPFRQVYLRLADLLADVCATLPDSEPTVDLSPKDVSARMATTLVIGIVATRPSEDGTHAVTVVRLGDTSAWIVDAEDGWIALGEVKNAGNVIAESATACLPLVPESDPVPVQTTLGADAALLLITDGIGDPLGSGGGEVGRELARMWARPPHPIEFAAQVAFGRKTFDDDRGAIAVWLAVPE